MKKINLLGFTLMALMFLSSCGSGLMEKTVTPKETIVKGELGKYLEVVEGTYKMVHTPDGWMKNWEIEIKFKRTGKKLEFDLKEARFFNETYVCIDLLDETPIVKFFNTHEHD